MNPKIRYFHQFITRTITEFFDFLQALNSGIFRYFFCGFSGIKKAPCRFCTVLFVGLKTARQRAI
jgi:hypothetical protein